MRSIDRRVLLAIIAVLCLAVIPVAANFTELSTATRSPDNNAVGATNGDIGITPHEDIDGVIVQISQNTESDGDVVIRDENFNEVARVDASGYSSGDEVSVYASLEAGTEYSLIYESPTTDTNIGYYNTDETPVESSAISITSPGGFGRMEAFRSVTAFVDSSAPVLSNPSPSNSTLKDGPVNLSVDVDDPSLERGDEVAVTFYLQDGSSQDPSSDTELGSVTVNQNSTASYQWNSVTEGTTQWYAVAEDGTGNQASTDTQEFKFENFEPQFGVANPKGEQLVTDSPVELNISVSDPDFGTSQGDELTVTFYDESDGSELGTQTITQNQTVTETFDDPVAGTNEWSVRVEDSYGNIAESETFSFQTPEVLELRNESAPNNLITNEGTVEVRFFGQESGEVISRTTSDGTIDMTGLPVDEPLIASTDVDGYFQRSIAIDSILEQQRMFLLPESADASQVDWVLDDNSGRFDPGETTLFIERPIEIDGETKYRTIYGEQFGGTGRTASTLATGDRYRLRVQNQDGNTRLLGSYLAAGAAQETLTVGSVDFPGLDDTGTAFSAVLDEEDSVIDYRFADDEAETDELTVEVYKNGELVQNATLNGPIQTVREQIPLSELNHSEGDSYRVEYTAQRNGIVINGDRIVGDVREIADEWNIDPGLLNLLGMITVMASFGAVVILSPRHAGLVASSVAFALSLIGVVAMNQVLIAFAFVVSGVFAAAGGNP